MGWRDFLAFRRKKEVDDVDGSYPFDAPRSVAETDSFQRMSRGEEQTVGGEPGGVAFSAFDRVADENVLYKHGDVRALQYDVESIKMLEDRFPSAFKKADETVRQRQSTSSLRSSLFYDYNDDRLFQVWKKDQKAIRERLQIHWLDDTIDHPLESLVHFARLFTTTGLFYGLGRTAYLYRTMDKAYAKLNSVSLGSIMLTEVSLAVCKGAGVAVGATAGMTCGDTIANLFSAICSEEVSIPERNGNHVLCAGVGTGFGAGAVFAALHYSILTPWGMRAAIGGFTTFFSAIGAYLGYYVYQPFASQRTHRLYEPYWRPWSERLVGYGGPHHVRGRYT